LERQRSMSFPPAPPIPEQETTVRVFPVINNTAQKNPFASKGLSMKFSSMPAPVRTNMFQVPLPPPPPPPPEEEV
jgi:hypothetical protein